MLAFAALVSGCGKYGTRYTGTGVSGGGSGTDRLVTDKEFDAAERARAGCTDVVEYESEGRAHAIQSPSEKGTYKVNPPTSGDHYAEPSEWGIYDKQQPDVKTVHSLEHGYIVISYAGISDDEVAELVKYVKRDPTHLLLQPRPANPKVGEEPNPEAKVVPSAGATSLEAGTGAAGADPDGKPDPEVVEPAPKDTGTSSKAEAVTKSAAGAGADAKPVDPKASGDAKADDSGTKGDGKGKDTKSKEKPAKVRPGIYYSAWTAQMYCRHPSAPALQFMIDEWRDQGPELFSTDAGKKSSS